LIDLLYLVHNRVEFTCRSFAALLANTDWSKVRSIHVYDDDSTDGTAEFFQSPDIPLLVHMHRGQFGGPVAIMNDFLTTVKPDLFAKIDNDVMLPLNWLGECLTILEQNPTVDLLGIEAHHPVQAKAIRRYAEPTGYIGGIGLMRGRAFQYGLPRPDGRFGFTAWQDHEAEVKKAWINPALPVCLLDRLPLEPWVSLSKRYVENKWQREWPPYAMEQRDLWSWFA
jgi:cellulose synthase/poly-beta-1,6-N-acetylglucosamine synthase-like glycosyltransferase